MTEQSELPDAIWPTRVQGWFGEYVPADDPQHPGAAWAQYAGSAPPVLTLLGGYDSGKSSLLRRLLVDAGVTCPEWLTISARHETFGVCLIEQAGLVFRDTPGLSTDAADPRGEENNRRALAAAGLTDALLVVLPPQLATGELDALREVVDQGWLPGSLRFVISRFDEAGVDPTGDLPQYKDLAARKVQELRREFVLSENVPVSVVAPDAFQLAGELRQPDPSMWDPYRDWDGMQQIQAGLMSLTNQEQDLRAAAAVRYWAAALHTSFIRLSVQQEKARSALATAGQGRKSTKQLIGRLDELESGARAGLDGLLTSALDQALQVGLDDDTRLRQRTGTALQVWFDESMAELSRFIQDADAEFARETSRPAWRDLDAVLLGLLPGPAKESPAASAQDDAATGKAGERTKRLLEVNKSLSSALKEVKTVFAKRTRDFSASASSASADPPPTTPAPGGASVTGGMGRALAAGDVLVAVGPALVDIFTFVSDLRREREQQRAQERHVQEIEQRMEELRRTVGKAAFSVFAEHIEGERLLLTESADTFARLSASLADRVALLELARTSAHDLLQAAPALT
jgi:hypothetical protein